MYLARSSPTVLTWFMDASLSGLQRPHSGTPRPPGASTPSQPRSRALLATLRNLPRPPTASPASDLDLVRLRSEMKRTEDLPSRHDREGASLKPYRRAGLPTRTSLRTASSSNH